MKTVKFLLTISILGMAALSAVGCSGRPISASQAYAAADELDPANKAVATDPRNKDAAHGNGIR